VRRKGGGKEIRGEKLSDEYNRAFRDVAVREGTVGLKE